MLVKCGMIPYGRQKIDKKDIASVKQVLESDFLTQGPKIAEFEHSLAEYCNSKYAVAVCNGTAALHLAYLASGIKNGDEAITTPNTFAATSNMLIAIGAKPVFCDIKLDTYNIDEDQIEKLITKKTKAIIPVHFAGHPCEMNKILKIARKYKLTVIEDACHALGASYKNKKIGSIGDMTIFSFHPVKSITTGEGGAILTSNKDMYEKLISLRSHGIKKNKDGKNIMTELGYNYRLTDIQAGLGLSQLNKLDDFIKTRSKIVSWYEKELANVEEISLPQYHPHCLSAWHLYVIRTNNPAQRDKLASHLKNSGIGVNYHYPAVYSHPYYQKNGFKNVHLNNEDLYDSTCVTLPMHTHLQQKDIKYIANQIKNFYGIK